MHGSGGHRLRWSDLPAPVHAAVAEVLGSPVVRAVSQSGGFSPGAADRVVTADGTRAFVKAVSAAQNAESPRLQEREARITATLPPGIPAPGFRGARWVGDWHVLVLDEVPGHQPDLPWRASDLDAVLAALDRLAGAGTPCPVPDLPTARESLAGELPGPALDLLDGDTLVHLDLRADNLLLTPAGAVLVDWPHACRGPAWLDLLTLLFEVDRLGEEGLAERVLTTSALTRDVEAEVLTTVLDGFRAFFLDRAAQPVPPGLPTLREFQRVQGEALARWVGRRRSGVR